MSEKVIHLNNPNKFHFNFHGKYKDISGEDITNTFRYIFHKFKKGIFVKIINNELKVFLPFSKAKFINEWEEKIQIDKTKYESVREFIKYVYSLENRKFNERYINTNINEWYANNHLLRFEYPINEGDTNVCCVQEYVRRIVSTSRIT